jgi:hypothetical protein
MTVTEAATTGVLSVGGVLALLTLTGGRLRRALERRLAAGTGGQHVYANTRPALVLPDAPGLTEAAPAEAEATPEPAAVAPAPPVNPITNRPYPSWLVTSTGFFALVNEGGADAVKAAAADVQAEAHRWPGALSHQRNAA